MHIDFFRSIIISVIYASLLHMKSVSSMNPSIVTMSYNYLTTLLVDLQFL